MNHERVVKSEIQGMYTAITQKLREKKKENLSIPTFKNVISKGENCFFTT